jgi:4-hydroxy-4-methyl-2-oxoglutarate aldolase
MQPLLPDHHDDGMDVSLLRRAADLGAATLHEALGRTGQLPSAIKPVAIGMKLCGRAYTVESPPGSNLALHHAIYAAAAGDILVVSVRSGFDYGYWGDIMTRAALQRGLGGLVIDGCVRDGELLERLGLAIFARGYCIRGTEKYRGGVLGGAVVLGETVVSPGDVVVGDRDGVVVIPQRKWVETMHAAAAREAKEKGILEGIAVGATTLRLLGLPQM